MIDRLVEEINYLKKKIAKLQLENKQLRCQHEFAFESWRDAIKRSGRLSQELARGTREDMQKTRVAPYTTIVVKARPTVISPPPKGMER